MEDRVESRKRKNKPLKEVKVESSYKNESSTSMCH
jgi:hypothetical protein